MFLTYKFRIKDKGCRKKLVGRARAVNFVWNYLCETQRKAESNRNAGRAARWPSRFDLEKLCAGVGAELGIGSESINQICRVFAESRNAARRHPKWRVSTGPRKSLGWVPFKGQNIRVVGDKVTCYGLTVRFWKSRDLPGTIKMGAFVQDARGRWYVTFACETKEVLPTGDGSVGIDLGLKAVATCSDGTVIPALRHYRQYEDRLAVAQRAGNRKRVAAIHAKVANARKHHLHEWSAKIARENSLIVIGDISPSKLAKTTMAKSILDASWAMLRKQLRYKASRHGAAYVEVDERFTSQVCSACGCISAASPKGLNRLGIRAWECSECGVSHDRDVNAAKNILRLGLERQPPSVGIAA